MRARSYLHWVLIFIALGSGAVVRGASGVPQSQAGKDELSRLKQKWQLEVLRLGDTNRPLKAFVTMRPTILKRLQTNASSDAVEFEFRRICATEVPAIEKDYHDLDTCYDTVLLQALVAQSVDQRDRLRLVRLLSRNCPGWLEQLRPTLHLPPGFPNRSSSFA